MSLFMVVSCDRPVPYGTCAARLHTGVSTEAEAHQVAERAGWQVGGTTYLCPGCAPRRTPSRGPRCGNNPNTVLSLGDQEAVADFKAYLRRRANGGPARPGDTPAS
ncbi:MULTISPECIES: hypothetical protein [unclassified Streptomyces]|uniref:hypothetical protein n=1 Tax=unclassified Streptomyces TaxID=2593676 RepID=UPI00382B7A99